MEKHDSCGRWLGLMNSEIGLADCGQGRFRAATAGVTRVCSVLYGVPIFICAEESIRSGRDWGLITGRAIELTVMIDL